jgi:outer membrane protein OmpA-like peptidoglycan-associated protein
MNKTFTKLFILIIFTSSALILGCSSTKPASKIIAAEFKGISQIKRGESASLKWKFENAQNVRIAEKQRNFSPEDSTSIKTDSSDSFTFVATNGADTLVIPWKIYVYDQIKDLETGPLSENTKNQKSSFINSKYLSGVKKYQSGSPLEYLKLMRYYYPFENKNLIRAKVLVLDEFGNYVSGYGTKESDFITMNAQIGCSDNFKSSPVTGFTEILPTHNEGVDFALILDNSSIAGDYFPIYDQIESFTHSLDSNDRFGLYSFNQNFKESISLRNSSLVSEMVVKPEKCVGLSAIFKSLKNCIDIVSKDRESRQKAIVLIAYSTDNASIIYDRNDIIDLAKSKDIPVYVIGIGNAVDSYSLSSVANLSGARYYEIEESQINDLPLIFNEILFSQKSHYQFDITVPAEQTGGCSVIHTKMEFVTASTNSVDSLTIPAIRQRHEFNYMAVASFAQGDTVLTEDYHEPVLQLANILKKNPKLSIELIGNSSIEGNDKVSYTLGMKRVQQVRKLLIQLGADPSKIRIRSDGSNNPIYYLQDAAWMQYYNRRVELRWLDPELLPYEVIAQVNETETEALANVEKWEDRGYKAYYERFLQSNIPVYRVKLWGYANLQEAEKLAKKLTQDYGMTFVVQ